MREKDQGRHPKFWFGTLDEGCCSVDIENRCKSRFGINKGWSIPTMEYYLMIKRNKVLVHSATWVNLKIYAK